MSVQPRGDFANRLYVQLQQDHVTPNMATRGTKYSVTPTYSGADPGFISRGGAQGHDR